MKYSKFSSEYLECAVLWQKKGLFLHKNIIDDAVSETGR
jgi:hypothetical protein